MYSPIRKASSIRKKMPEKMSRTSDCAPKPMARPITPAPASNGPMSSPTAESRIITVVTEMTIAAAIRSIGTSVPRRLRTCAVPPSPSPPSVDCRTSASTSSQYLAVQPITNCQAT